jgi:tetratricopeptide (TPR) repeat protein
MSAQLTAAVELHRNGKLEEAASVYRRLLADHPNHVDALHLLGVLAQQQGDPRRAVELISRAIELQPNSADFHANLAEAYRAQGQLERALSAARSALELVPNHAAAANNLALTLLDQGNHPEAVHWFRQALQSNPHAATIHNNLGNALRLLRHPGPALEHFRRAVALDANLAEAHANLGQLLLEQYQRPAALTHCQKAVRLAPQLAQAHSNLGNLLRELGRLAEARACYEEALRLRPDLGLVYNNMGQLLQEEGRPQEAIPWYHQALEREPNSARIHTHLASALEEQDLYDEAAPRYRQALLIDPNCADAHNGLGHALHEKGQFPEAIAEYHEVLRLHPGHAPVYCNLGIIFEELGKMDEAKGHYRQAVQLDPDHAGAYSQLATMLRAQLPAEDLAAMQRLLAQPGTGQARESVLRFGLAQYLDAQGQHEEAARHLQQANALTQALRQQRGTAYDRSGHVEFADGLVKICTPDFFARIHGFGLDTERPIFIVGLPRSGTTLTEQILASHSQVFGAGELCYTFETFQSLPQRIGSKDPPLSCLGQMERKTVRQAANWHMHRLKQLNQEALRVADKMPENYVHLGLLAVMFPRARFIHCRRDLRDVAVSCWMTNFRQVRWASDQENIASHFTQYLRLMDHWREVLPVPILEVDYEETVADLEGVARKLVAWCGLEWEPACLAFHKSSRPIRTASVSQVRQPIYQRSVARWKHYEPVLKRLFSRLEELDPRLAEQV